MVAIRRVSGGFVQPILGVFFPPASLELDQKERDWRLKRVKKQGDG